MVQLKSKNFNISAACTFVCLLSIGEAFCTTSSEKKPIFPQVFSTPYIYTTAQTSFCFHEHGWHFSLLKQRHQSMLARSHCTSPTYPAHTEISYTFLGSSRTVDATQALSHKLVGPNATAPSASSVMYRELYPSIDMKVYLSKHLKYDIIVKPGGELDQVVLQISGGELTEVTAHRVLIRTPYGNLEEHIPLSYQVIEGDTLSREVRYIRKGNQQIGFEVETYDPNYPLIIDPELLASSYGGKTWSNGVNACSDNAGNTYVAGIYSSQLGGSDHLQPTSGVFQPSFSGQYDIGIMKFNSNGTDVLYYTYLGGSAYDYTIHSLIHPSGDLIVFGVTYSSNFPTSPTAFSTSLTPSTSTYVPVPQPLPSYDMFLARISPDGETLKGSTYIGGSHQDGISGHWVTELLDHNFADHLRGEVIVDTDENLVIASYTSSPDFPMAESTEYKGGPDSYTASGIGIYDGIVLKVKADLTDVLWAKYVAGRREEVLYSIQVTTTGYYVTGLTTSDDLPFTTLSTPSLKRTRTPASPDAHRSIDQMDGFIVHIRRDDQVIDKGTYIGTDRADGSYLIDVGPSGNVYIYGQTTHPEYPIVSSSFGDVYSEENGLMILHALNADLSETVFSTRLGATDRDTPHWIPTAFRVDDCGSIYLIGWGGGSESRWGSTTGLTTTQDATQSTTDGEDVYMMVLLPYATDVSFATFFGGNAHDRGYAGQSRISNTGILSQALTVCNEGDTYPTTSNAWAEDRSDSRECELAYFKYDIGVGAGTLAKFSTNNQEDTDPGLSSGCVPLTVAFKNESIGDITQSEWDFGDGMFTPNNNHTIHHTFTETGRFKVRLKIPSGSGAGTGCFLSSDIIVEKIIEVFDDTVAVSEDPIFCVGEEVQLYASGGVSYNWSPTDHLSDGTSGRPIVKDLETSQEFSVEITTPHGCKKTEQIVLTAHPQVTIDLDIAPLDGNCAGSNTFIIRSQMSDADYNIWHMGDGNLFNQLSELTYTYSAKGEYTLKIEAGNAACYTHTTQIISTNSLFVPNVITPNSDGQNDDLIIEATYPLKVRIFDRNGTLVYNADRYQNDWNGGNLPSGVYYYTINTETTTQELCRGWVHVVR